MPNQTLSLDQFMYRDRCPACRSKDGRIRATQTVFRLAEKFPQAVVTLGEDVVQARRLYVCHNCSLWYYNYIPSPDLVQFLLDQPSLIERWGTKTDRPTFQRARRVIHSYLQGTGTILDVGAHHGGFLDTLEPGWRKVAVEPMRVSSSHIQDTRILNGFLEEVELGEATYDCISAFDVFEHLSDPCVAVNHIAHAMKPGGIVIIETGTANALVARCLGGAWYYLNFLEHFQAFNQRSLQSLFARHGFTVVIAERVRHTNVSAKIKLRSFAAVALYSLVTGFGRETRLWRRLAGVLHPQGLGAPPSTIGIESDHLFMVAQKNG